MGMKAITYVAEVAEYTVTIAVTTCGTLLAAYGAYRFVRSAFESSLFYLCSGFFLVLTFNREIRFRAINKLPSEVRKYLYEKTAVDAIVDLTETGSSLRANKLRVVDVLMETNTVLIANKKSWANNDKKAKIENIALMLDAALQADTKVGLKLNVERSKLSQVLSNLPALRNPTISSLADDRWIAVETVIEKKVSREIIPALKRIGAEGIVEYPLNKIVP